MSSLGGQERQGSLVTFQVELPETLDGILDKIREIILKGDVRSVLIKEDHPISYQRFVPPGEEIADINDIEAVTDLSLADIVRNTEMEEFSIREQGLLGTPTQSIFFWTYLFLEHSGWIPSYLLVSESSKFWTWLGLPKKLGTKIDRFMGMRVERDKAVPSDVYLLCAARHKGAAMTEIKYSLKVCMEEPDARGNKAAFGDRNHSSTHGKASEDVEKSTAGRPGRNGEGKDAGGVVSDHRLLEGASGDRSGVT